MLIVAQSPQRAEVLFHSSGYHSTPLIARPSLPYLTHFAIETAKNLFVFFAVFLSGSTELVGLAVWPWNTFITPLERSSHQSVHVKEVTPPQWRLDFEPAINF